MSAFCGIYSPLDKRRASRELPAKMLHELGHRGGGGEWQYVEEKSGFAIAANVSATSSGRRESPKWHEDSDYIAALDGHIYNWRSLIHDETPSDNPATAAIALMHDSPSDFPNALDGSFTLALWEKPSRRLWLVRDPLGRKPLYYSVLETGAILFASEPKAILEHRGCAPRLSWKALSAYITFACVPAPLTLFEGVNKLFPGEVLQVDPEGVVTKHDYWHMPPFEPYAHSLEDLAGPIREGLLKTLEKQIRNAERVGVFLSGGADSTIILGALKLLGVRERHSFTLSHSEEGLQVDNREDCDWARSVATLHGSTHHIIDVDARPTAPTRASELLRLFDDPLILENRACGADLLSGAAAKVGIDVCLSGNSQRPFGGIWEWKVLRDLLKKDSARHLTAEELVLEANFNLFSKGEQCRLLRTSEEDVTKVAASLLDRYIRAANTSDLFDVTAASSMLMRSPEQFIPFEERVAVTNGIEVCYPYFDPILMKVANAIPASLRGAEAESMSLAALCWAFRDVLPDDVADRRKVAYPRDPWTDDESPKFKEVFLSKEALGRSGVFDPSVVQGILSASEHRSNIVARRQMWTLLFFQIWFDCYLKGDGTAQLDEAFETQ